MSAAVLVLARSKNRARSLPAGLGRCSARPFAARHFVIREHCRASSDQHVLRDRCLANRLADLHRLVHQVANLQSLLDDFADLREIQRLDQIVECAEFHGPDGRVTCSRRRNKDHRQFGVNLLNLTECLRAGLIGESGIEEHDVRLSFRNEPQTVAGTIGNEHIQLLLPDFAFEGFK